MSFKKIINRIRAAFARIPEDKVKHFLAGFAIAAVVSLFLGYIIGIIAAIVTAAGKEIYDKVTGKGTPELLDFVFTFAGAIVFTAISAGLSKVIEALLIASCR